VNRAEGRRYEEIKIFFDSFHKYVNECNEKIFVAVRVAPGHEGSTTKGEKNFPSPL